MDKLQDQYNERLIKLAREFQAERHPNLYVQISSPLSLNAEHSNSAVLWQPANIPLASYPIEGAFSISAFTCFLISLAFQR